MEGKLKSREYLEYSIQWRGMPAEKEWLSRTTAVALVEIAEALTQLEKHR